MGTKLKFSDVYPDSCKWFENVSYMNKYSYCAYDSGSWVFQCVVSYIAAGVVWLGWPDLAGMGSPLSVGWLVGRFVRLSPGWLVCSLRELGTARHAWTRIIACLSTPCRSIPCCAAS